MNIDELGDLRNTCQTAFREWDNANGRAARLELQALGRAVLASGGVKALCALQGELHDAEIHAFGSATRGDGFRPAGILGDAWEAIPEWANL